MAMVACKDRVVTNQAQSQIRRKAYKGTGVDINLAIGRHDNYSPLDIHTNQQLMDLVNDSIVSRNEKIVIAPM